MLLELHKFYMRNVFIYHIQMPNTQQAEERCRTKSTVEYSRETVEAKKYLYSF